MSSPRKNDNFKRPSSFSRTSAVSSSSMASSLSSTTDVEEERRKEFHRSEFSLEVSQRSKIKPSPSGFTVTTSGCHERLLLVNGLPFNDTDGEDTDDKYSTTRHLPYRRTMINGRVYVLKNQWV
ncbi:uncharacterized protein IUM83_08720 [Phytophthora cinnamomi]|uniref:uncharacterized protein n=1 Tax=Phytophthora cinnamomi TaxID=4785 RepID=UPI003559D4DC|nr:hypothetical protein IUM83_08720 [Phytophthora cinnamomi]